MRLVCANCGNVIEVEREGAVKCGKCGKQGKVSMVLPNCFLVRWKE